jgi:hypothetical protein
MNERIRELARQADPDYTGNADDDMGNALVGDKAIEKFARLIVQECAAYAFSHEEDYYAMLNHFGVEE